VVARWVTVAAALIAACTSACVSHKPYACNASEQCTRDGIAGVCEAEGFCSFPDPACPGGRRFDDTAGNGLGGQCVESGTPDAGACGAVGMACCTTEPACGGNAFCDAGTCRQCVTDVAHGRHHGCALEYDGSVKCFGANDSGQLGTGIAGGDPTATASEVREVSTGTPIDDATAIGAGRDWACAVRTGGSVWCWGDNGSGQLGNNAVVDSPWAVQVVKEADGMPLTGMVSVQGGECSTCALADSGEVWCWGCNGSSSLGDGTTTPRDGAAPVLATMAGPPFAGALTLAVGGGHACVERALGEVWCWGQNSDSQLGDDTTTAAAVPIMSSFTGEVALGRWHTCGVASDGSVLCWGWGGHGRLANGVGWDPPDFRVPTPIRTAPNGPPLTGAREAAAAALSCAVMQDGTAMCWGDDHYGQTGVGGTGSPMPLHDARGERVGGIVRLWAGFTRGCVQLAGGDIQCWGRNNEGQLADPSFVNHTRPTSLGLTCP
jgi:alpha-tubulin suppressor-like RCC1 family protein